MNGCLEPLGDLLPGVVADLAARSGRIHIPAQEDVVTSRRSPMDGQFISWFNPDGPHGVVTMLVEVAHRNGHILRDVSGVRDQFDSLPRRWRPATSEEIVSFRSGVAS